MRPLVVIAIMLGTAAELHAITIPTVPVGNAGSINDWTSHGAVAYDYRIGTYEVTVGQYTTFLNSVAATDAYSLYNPSMDSDLNVAGIQRNGSSGNYTYSVVGSQNKPVTYVSWGDAARFANWLHNGQPTGAQNTATTENGAYALNGAVTDGALLSVARNSGAQWFLPSDDEWYKAAYHKNDGATANYWDYPTSTDSPPLSAAPPGNAALTPSNTANIRTLDGKYAVTGVSSYSASQNYLTDVGAYTLSTSPYGTFDQGGNALEWNEGVLTFGADTYRGARGGAWGTFSNYLEASGTSFSAPTDELNYLGFRVATIPEPSTYALAAIGVIGLLAFRRRKSAA